MKFYIVDAFTDTLFGGNPAGVVLLPEGADFPSDEVCVKTAAELRYSETAFIKKLGEKEFRIRYFTPAAEVELCGHATIGSFTALLYAGIIKPGEVYMNHTLSGDLNIEVNENGVLMDMAVPQKINEITSEEALEELYEIMGISYQEQKEKGIKLHPQMISTGLPDIMMPVCTLADLEAIEPDMKRLSDLSARYEVVGVHAFTLDCNVGGLGPVEMNTYTHGLGSGDGDATCHVRNFAPLYDIDEEAATGTSNGALTYYGYLNGFVFPGDDCKFVQGEKMDRPSVILSHIEVNGDDVKIQVGGSGVILAEGEINL